MGTSAVILKNRFKYSPEKLLSDTIVATFHANLQLYFQNDTNYTQKGEFCYTTLNVTNKTSNEIDRQEDVEIYGDDKFDWIFKLEDMERLKKLPYDPSRCYKDPKLILDI